MYTSFIDNFLSDSFVVPTWSVYVVSDNQLEVIKRKQRQDELDDIEAYLVRLEERYQARIKVFDERMNELKEEIKDFSPAKGEVCS